MAISTTSDLANVGLGEQLGALKIRAVKVVLTLERGAFFNNSNTKTIYACSLPGYIHVDATVQRMPSYFGNNAVVTIYGMTKDDCEAATKYNTLNMQFYNQVEIYAGYIDSKFGDTNKFGQSDVEEAMDLLPEIFVGAVMTAYTDFNDVNRPFIIHSNFMAGNIARLMQHTTINNQTNFSQFAQSIINNFNHSQTLVKWNLGGVFPEQIINNGSYSGTHIQQLHALCHDYNMQMIMNVGKDNSINITFSQIGYNNGGQKFILNTETGLIGYPVALPFGIAVKEFFNPQRNVNDSIKLETYYKALAGDYYVWQMQSVLQTMDDLWESSLTLYVFENTAFGG
jgi:hypothetical protein